MFKHMQKAYNYMRKQIEWITPAEELDAWTPPRIKIPQTEQEFRLLLQHHPQLSLKDISTDEMTRTMNNLYEAAWQTQCVRCGCARFTADHPCCAGCREVAPQECDMITLQGVPYYERTTGRTAHARYVGEKAHLNR